MSHDFPSSSLDACALLVREKTGAYRPAQFDEVLRAAQLLLVRRVVDVNYLDRSATTIVAGGDGE